jgi:hypothetical protein
MGGDCPRFGQRAAYNARFSALAPVWTMGRIYGAGRGRQGCSRSIDAGQFDGQPGVSPVVRRSALISKDSSTWS